MVQIEDFRYYIFEDRLSIKFCGVRSCFVPCDYTWQRVSCYFKQRLIENSKFDVSKLPPDIQHSAVMAKLKSMVNLNEVTTISVLKVKTCYHSLQLSNLASYPFHVYFVLRLTQF